MKFLFTIIIFAFLSNHINAQKQYTNKAFGFSIEFPENWSVSSKPDTTKDLFLSNEQRTKMLEKERSVFLTEYYYFPALSQEILIPKIQINVVIKNEKDFNSFKKEAISSAEKLKKHLDDFEYISKPAEITISGIKSIYFTIKYTMMIRGQRITIKNHSYAVPYKNYLFHISLVDGPFNDCSKDFEKLISTIKVVN